MRFEALLASMRDAPVVPKGDYRYYVFPITDGVPAIPPDSLREVVAAIVATADLDIDRIVTMEAMGIPIATALSLETGVPFTIIRKRGYGLPGEREVEQRTGYSKNAMFINGLSAGDRVTVVDDIISTGGTLIAVLGALIDMGVEIADVVMVVDKGDGRERVRDELGIEVKCLVRVEDDGEGPRVTPLV
ncbi:MAG: purine phosphoribosyltransferase family protein [Thermoplasmata archaeon]|nr:purine phosphoribosyltransferase family protein [Thermoplasmata archaeon]